MGSPTSAIYKWQGYNTARAVSRWKRTVDKSYFDQIYWTEMDGVMRKRNPNMFRVSTTKYVIRTCGIDAHLSKIDSTKYKNERPDNGRTEFFQATVEKR